MRKLFSLATAALLMCGSVKSQILQVSPLFPTRSEPITITYDATSGNGALAGVSPIYAHTGLITPSSVTDTDWFNTQGNWGTADSHVLMTGIGDNKYSISYTVNSFYSATAADTILALAFVFRNTDGSIVGRNADGSNINLRIYDTAFHAAFISPYKSVRVFPLDTTLNIFAAANRNCQMSLSVNGNLLQQVNGDSLFYNNYHFLNYGAYNFVLQATTDSSVSNDTFTVMVNPPVTVQSPPAGLMQGINYVDDSTVTLKLVAPYKNFIYVLGDFNNWQFDTAYMMKQDTDGHTWWLTVKGLTPQKEYIFQYVVDGYIWIGDPYSEKVSDPWVDPNIPTRVYPDLIKYPYGNANGIASVIETAQPQYNWQVTNFQRPAKTKLTIYEMLIRDFQFAGSYAAAIDSLNYLKTLGINCIELMPVMNFESNSSWGYNPNYFCAAEKIYGPKDSLKSFIDACHGKGMAVLLDIPFNDAFGTNPMVMMYWDTIHQLPASNNPWFNVVAPHPYSVGYDFNHLSSYTRQFVKQVTRYWLKEYHTDGYRFDLTKGYTQTYSGNDVTLWGEYDASRVAILEGMVDSIWAADPTAICVFEQLSENQEETELANHGILLWGIMNAEYNQATMGYSTGWDLSWASYQDRGWSQPNLDAYMESHDEERLMYNNEQYGDSITGYDIKPVDTGLQRMEAAGNVFFTLPGPKMIWMFGELGYDISINSGCRICNKPILWSYTKNAHRMHLYRVWSALINLRSTYPTFQTTNYTINLTGNVKSIQLNDTAFNAVAVANFDEYTDEAAPGFQHTGWWYDYFTGDSLNVTSTSATMSYQRSEYHLYTDKRLPLPNLTTSSGPTGIDEVAADEKPGVLVYPNPTAGRVNLMFSMEQSDEVTLSVYNLNGQMVYQNRQNLPAGVQLMQADINSGAGGHVASGIYFYHLQVGQSLFNGKISLVNQ